MSDDLTRDNLQLSEVTKGERKSPNAINCSPELAIRIQEYVQASRSKNTRIAYVGDLAHFENWGGKLPASPETIAEYLIAHADALSFSTLRRRLAALSLAHRSKGWSNPTSSEIVKSVVRGLSRIKGTAQRQAQPLLTEELLIILSTTAENLRDLRDRALLLIGFAGGFRRSELVGLNCGDIEPVRQGIIVTLRRSKTDQTAEGRKIGIPFARGLWCPVRALHEWNEGAGVAEGALFRSINRHQQVSHRRLSGEAVCLILKSRLAAAGMDSSNFSGHSLRAGLATSAARAGVPAWKIRQQTGHASDAMLNRYVRDSELFAGNALCSLL